MRFGARNLIGLAAATTLFAIACSDSPVTQPAALGDPAASQSALLGTLTGSLTGTVTSLLVAPVHRATALPEDVSWSFVAGPLGARSSNASVGLTVQVPPGALDQTVRITVTALKGTVVAYRFEPHLEFDGKVVLTQDLRGLENGLLNLTLKGAHFDGDEPTITSGGLAVVDEVVSALLNLLTNSVSFRVEHFSGWIVASGYSE